MATKVKARPRKNGKPKKPKAPAPPTPAELEALVDVYYRAYLALPDEAKEDLFIKLANDPRQFENVVDIACLLERDPKEETIPFEQVRRELGLAP